MNLRGKFTTDADGEFYGLELAEFNYSRSKELFANKLVSESDQTAADFYAFIWEYLLDDREITDLKKEWKAWRTPHR
jgi:hypothetical protein